MYTAIILSIFIIWNLPAQSEAVCPDPSAMRVLNTDSILGTWYEYMTHQRVYETFGKCASVEFTKNKREEGVLEMKVTEIVNGEEVIDIAKIKKNDLKDKSGNFEIIHFLKKRTTMNHRLELEKETNQFRVLGTNGNCWAVTYTCDENFMGSNGRATVLVRSRDLKCLTPNIKDNIEAELNKINTIYGAVTMTSSLLTTEINQNGCE